MQPMKDNQKIETLRRKVMGAIQELASLRLEHGLRARTLPADLVLIGLTLDVEDASSAALDLLSSPRPHRAYALLRTAFEAAQRILALATHEAYLEMGARAWVYYQRKEKDLIGLLEQDSANANKAGNAEEWLQTRIGEMAQIWGEHHPLAEQVLREQNALLAKSRRPDNFLGRNITEALKESYERIAAACGGVASGDLASIDKLTYASLSREAHARMRIEPRMLRVDADGHVEAQEAPHEPTKVRLLIISELLGILGDASLGIEYRLAKRRAEQEAILRQAERIVSRQVPNDSHPDFGLMLLRRGVGQTRHSFPGVPIRDLGILADGTLSVNTAMSTNGLVHAVTFDFKGHARNLLVGLIPPEDRKHTDLRNEVNSPRFVSLERPILVDLTASLGSLQNDGVEAFIPLLVADVRLSEAVTE